MGISLGRALALAGSFVYALYTGNWSLFISTSSSAHASRVAKRDRNRAIAKYNASLKDRLEMAEMEASAPRHLVMGRVRFVEGIRRRWSSGVNREKLTMIVSYGFGQFDGFETWYANDVELTLDGSGWATNEPYSQTARKVTGEQVSLDGAGNATITLAHPPIAGTVNAWLVESGRADTSAPISITVVGSVANLAGGSGRAGRLVQINYNWNDATSYLRIRPYLGGPGQNVGADLAGEYPGELTSAQRFADTPLAVVDCIFNPDVFPQGRPNIVPVLRGVRVYDPRKDSTVPGGSGAHRIDNPATWEFSENPALHAYHYARHPYGWALPAARIMSPQEVAAEAAFCDTVTNFTLRKADGSTSVVTLPRYRCGIAIELSADAEVRRRAMDAIMESMAGADGWDGGVWRFRAGRKRAPVFTLDASWLANRTTAQGVPDNEPVVRLSNAYQREKRINRISGRCVDPAQRWQLMPFPAVEDSVLVATKGARTDDVTMEAVASIAHAQHLGTVFIRQAQSGTRLQALCGIQAYGLQLFDVGTILLPRLGMDEALGKTMELVRAKWSSRNGTELELADISDAQFTPVAELKGRDPAPDSNLPRPWTVEAVTGLVATTSIAWADGSPISRVQLTWNPLVDVRVRKGGRVEIQYTPGWLPIPSGDWPSWPEPGSATRTYIPGLAAGPWLFRARAVQLSPLVEGPWTLLVPLFIGPVDADIQAAIDAAAAAQAAADAAQADADTALGSLAALASDNVLTPPEKPQVVLDVSVILAERSGIEAQGVNYSVTTERVAYSDAVDALVAYLATLTAPTTWDDLAGNTTIHGPTFRAKFADVYVTRQDLLDAVSAAAKARLGDLATLDQVGTPQIEPNAATEVYTATVAGPVGYSTVT